jgi:hypothetical protein
MTLQSAIARAVHMATGLGQFRIRLPRGLSSARASCGSRQSGA